jgi:hypothetical protein
MNDIEEPRMATNEELEQVMDRLVDYLMSKDVGFGQLLRDLSDAVNATAECMALRNGIEHVIKTCNDKETVAYLRELGDKVKKESWG